VSDPIYGIRSLNGWNEETVASLGNRLDVSGILGVIPQRLPHFANRNSQTAIKIDKGVALPDSALDFLTSDNPSGIFQKDHEQTKRLLLQFYAFALF
jgi:hypothetical protein